MRSFVISLAIILICFCISTLNCIWTSNRIESLIEDATVLTADDISDFTEEWRRAETVLSFTSRRTFIREIEDALQRLECALEAEDEYETETARIALIYKMKEICRSQCFDLKSIL